MTERSLLLFFLVGSLVVLATCDREGSHSALFTPSPYGPFQVGSSPNSLAVADFNGDGRLDLAIANVKDNNITVLVGNGTGGFTEAPGSPIPVGTNPWSVAVGDFNGDGKLDLATANAWSGDVTVLLGNETGGFTKAPGSPFPAARYPRSVAIGDFNGDGKPDLAVVNGKSDNVTVLLGNGIGGFTNAPGSPFSLGPWFNPFTHGEWPFCVAVADFNADGKLDLAVSDTNSIVTVLLGNGTGGFAEAPDSPFRVGSYPKWVAVGDFNGDGKPDLAVVNRDNNNVTVLLNTYSGSAPPTRHD